MKEYSPGPAPLSSKILSKGADHEFHDTKKSEHQRNDTDSGKLWDGHESAASGWRTKELHSAQLEAHQPAPPPGPIIFTAPQGGTPLSRTGQRQTPAVTTFSPGKHAGSSACL